MVARPPPTVREVEVEEEAEVEVEATGEAKAEDVEVMSVSPARVRAPVSEAGDTPPQRRPCG